MKNCLNIKNRILAYIEKTLSQQELDTMKTHIETCDSCKSLVNKFTSVYSSLDSVNPEASPFFYSKTLARLEKGAEQESWMPVSLLNSLKPVLAGLLLLTVTTFGIFFSKSIYASSSASYDNNSESNLTASASDYYLYTSEDTMVELIISNEK